MKTTVYYRNGNSDKVYTAAIEPAAGCVSSEHGQLYRVTFAFGRRGDTLKPGTKTPSPVTRAEAEKIYAKLIAEKKGKGYVEGEDGTPYVGGDKEARATGIGCQLLNAVNEDGPGGVAELLADPEFGCQEKYDGKRMILRAEKGQVIAINRNGLTCGVSSAIEQALLAFHGDFGILTIDGESIGDVFFAFDMLEFSGIAGSGDMQHRRYEVRYKILENLLVSDLDRSQGFPSNRQALRVAPLAIAMHEKATMYAKLKAQQKEGIVFKRLSAAYNPGRPASGGDQFKFKFVESCTCRVVTDNREKGKRSIELAMVGDSHPASLVTVGQCTIGPNKEFPKVGALVEIRYLYAFRGGSLYQPFYLGMRDDLSGPDDYKSLKFKSFAQDDGSFGLED